MLFAGCHSSQEPVIRRGEDLLKRNAASANLEDPDLIKRLFLLFNGIHLIFIVSLLLQFRFEIDDLLIT